MRAEKLGRGLRGETGRLSGAQGVRTRVPEGIFHGVVLVMVGIFHRQGLSESWHAHVGATIVWMGVVSDGMAMKDRWHLSQQSG
jgi:predicted cupin superfamily sugar epimerase